jgi:hypothetical protein
LCHTPYSDKLIIIIIPQTNKNKQMKIGSTQGTKENSVGLFPRIKNK